MKKYGLLYVEIFKVILVLLLSNVSMALGQSPELDSLTQKFTAYRNRSLQEKIFAHLDRSAYVAGETMWFKLYYMDGYVHRPLDVSKVAYLEILDKDNKAVIQTKVSLKGGVGSGQLLLPFSMGSGNYLVRVYTNWMKNFSPEYYYQQQITIINTVRRTDPLSKNNSSKYDIQFFPEGGQLVDGIASTVAYHIVDETGKGRDISGAILGQRGDTIVSFRPLKFGIGKFTFLPRESEQYNVILKVKAKITAKLPAVQKFGYALHVSDTLANKLKITVKTKGVTSPSSIYLLAHTRQVVKIAQTKSIQNGTSTFLLDKEKLGEGISHFTLFTDNRQPVCERLYFKRPTEIFSVSAQADNKKYSTRQKIRIGVQGTSLHSGNFSMAVFKYDTLNQIPSIDIQSYEFLTSDLKGTIESPGFYFSNHPLVAEATDNLMLTHGWSRFKWEEILKNENQPILFNPEYRNLVVTGKIINAKSRTPATGIHAYLSSPGKNIKLYGSRSNSKGNIHFEMRDFYEKKKIIVQTNLNLDSNYQINIRSPYSETYSSFSLDPLNMSSAWKDPLIARSISMQTANTYFNKSTRHKEIPVDSTAFYGEPDEKYMLDDYTRFSVMEEVMREYVHGVWVRKKDGKFIFKVPDEAHHSIFQNESLVMLDGIPIFDVDKIMAFNPLKVQKLDVMMRKYYLGPFAFEGIVSYTTYKGDLDGFELDPRATVLDYQGLQLQKEFFSPKYETSTEVESRLGDYRNLLFWSPEIKLKGKESQFVEFYSSDEPGLYNVVIQGMNSDGIIGCTSSAFEVKSHENN